MNYVANRLVIIARRATQVVVTLRSQAAQQRKRTNLSQPSVLLEIVAQGLRAVCYVRLLVKGMAINFVACLASHSANLMCVVMRTYSVLP